MTYFLLLYYTHVHHRDLHSFPTRRSSDLTEGRFRRPLRLDGQGGHRGQLTDDKRADRFFLTRTRNRREVAAACHSSDRKSTRLNSSHTVISYAVFCLKKKKKKLKRTYTNA